MFVFGLGLAAASLHFWVQWSVSAGKADLDIGQWQVEVGQARKLEQGVQVEALHQGRFVLAARLAQPVPVAEFELVELKASSPVVASLIWQSDRTPGQTHRVAFDAQGKADLANAPGWSGGVVALGILLEDPTARDVVLEGLVLSATGPKLPSAVKQAFDGLGLHEPITQRSINFYNPPDTAPVTFQGLWLALVLGLGLAATVVVILWRDTPVLVPLGLVMLLGWFAMDARWQATLWKTHADSIDRYLGVPGTRLSFHGEDADLAGWLERAASKVPSSARVHVLSDNQYARLRAQYLLVPVSANGVASARVASRHMRPGDHVILIAPVAGVELANDGRALVLPLGGKKQRTLSVTPLESNRRAILLRVDEVRS